MADHTPHVDPVAKLITAGGAVLLLAAVAYLVISLINTINNNSTKGETVANPSVPAKVVEAKPAPAPTPASAPAAEAKPAEPAPAPAAVPAAAAGGDAEAGKAKFTSSCASCHGMNGEGQGMFPKLAGHAADKTSELLKKYRAGEQVGPNSAMMAPIAGPLSDADIANLAAYIAKI